MRLWRGAKLFEKVEHGRFFTGESPSALSGASKA